MRLLRYLLILQVFGNIFCIATGNHTNQVRLWFDPQDYTSTLGEGVILILWADGSATSNLSVRFSVISASYVRVVPEIMEIYEYDSFHCNATKLEATGLRAGRFIVKGYVAPDDAADNRRLFAQMKIALNGYMIYASLLVGWAYTACWSIGDYPQIILNHRKRSVVGLSFDYLYMNIVGNLCYATFNACMYWSKYVEQEYFDRHPFGLNPVIGNDVGYSIHALLATAMTLLQCYIFDNGGNSISIPAKGMIATYVLIILIAFVLVTFRVLHWLDFLYVLSYIKLSTNLVKYFPQVYINYKRQSTAGFAIMNRLLDLVGGLLSILQMIINAWNFDDWDSIFGSPVKFALGLVSIIFDVIFIIQHFYLYRKPAEISVFQSEVTKISLPSNT
ncbi:cystinosin homolog [Sabethes cyaneus]|uniref:cystinosin homolog n=1 Tax=Sabethes cyaneus TaxID=53552 RepID=UPI00237DD6D0|nr:cystinosin homolog [Sabethes cyaneus]